MSAVSYDLSGRTAVVTGGARGIGRAIVTRLLESGARVWVWDADPIDADAVDSLRVDVTSADHIARAIAQMIDRQLHIDILVNNAGYLGRLHAFEKHEVEDWHRIIEVNLLGMLEVTQRVLPHMRHCGGGRIVNMASLAGKEGLANLAAYSAASAGVIAFTKALGREVAGSGIFVNCVAPGPIDTDMTSTLGADWRDRVAGQIPVGRFGTSEEVAAAVRFLASDEAAFITGAVVPVDGGMAMGN